MKISQDFIKNRYIGENIRLIDGLIFKLTAHLYLLDCKKAFDSIKCEYMNAMNTWKIQFWTNILQMDRNMLHQYQGIVLYNGFSSGWLQFQKG